MSCRLRWARGRRSVSHSCVSVEWPGTCWIVFSWFDETLCTCQHSSLWRCRPFLRRQGNDEPQSVEHHRANSIEGRKKPIKSQFQWRHAQQRYTALLQCFACEKPSRMSQISRNFVYLSWRQGSDVTQVTVEVFPISKAISTRKVCILMLAKHW